MKVKVSNLFDLEIALSQIQEGVDQDPYWKVDRLLRNLLTDITGNTHRAEFCIDKLYSPDSSSGRLGILELRGFEMPPNQDMALVQLLFIRCFFAWFWQKPYHHKLIRWGTLLHDKFMIHHFVKQDMKDVVEQMNADGIAFQFEWLTPFFEFRFPLLGKRTINEIGIEIRMGLEPWQVLGEEMGSSGTARFVDSSVERVEVKVNNFNEERYAILCNQKIVPLHPTSTQGVFVSGIRYKAWNPPSALHPTLPVNSPLVFELYDKFNQKSIGGLTYHVSHPGGRSYDTYPVNSFEAESRRISRVSEFTHTTATKKILGDEIAYQTSNEKRWTTPVEQQQQFSTKPDKIKRTEEYPMTADLRFG